MSRRSRRKKAAAATKSEKITPPPTAPILNPLPNLSVPAVEHTIQFPFTDTTPLSLPFTNIDPDLINYYEDLRQGLIDQIKLSTQTLLEASQEFSSVIYPVLSDASIVSDEKQCLLLATALLTTPTPIATTTTTVPETKAHNIYDNARSNANNDLLSKLMIGKDVGSQIINLRDSDLTMKDLEGLEKVKQRHKRTLLKRNQKATAKADHKKSLLAESLDTGFDACVVTTETGENVIAGTGASSNVCLKVDGLEMAYDGGSGHLLHPSPLTLNRGRRYGLTGRNGVGKSTLLHHLAKLAPSNLSVLHVAQEAEGSDTTTALDSVLEADVRVTELIAREKKLLRCTMQSSTQTDELTQIAIELNDLDAASAPARAAKILNGLSFTAQMQASPTNSLSGGWRMRLALARALFTQPDILLLDEPTNHLDLHAVIWLEIELQKWASTLVVISHDSHFLNSIVTDVIEFRNKHLTTYKGNWNIYLSTAKERYLSQKREYDKQQLDVEHKQRFVDKWINNKYGHNSTMVQSRLKEISKMSEGGEQYVAKPTAPGKGIHFNFPNPESNISDPMISLQNVSFGYSPESVEVFGDQSKTNQKIKSKKKILFQNVSMRINRGSRIAVVGPNGAGKSTLLKLIIEEVRGGLRPDDGSVVSKGKIKIAWFHQHFVEQLDLNLCPLEEMRILMGVKPKEEILRRALGRFGIGADLATRQNCLLSGGQKARCAFAKLCVDPPDVFVLDEPTNHLDMESVEALADACTRFDGAVIFVSHDEYFCANALTELWHCDGSKIQQLHCGFEEYKDKVKRGLL